MALIRSSSDVQRNFSEVSELCRSTREPVYITRAGSPGAALVVIDAEAYEEQVDLKRRVYERELRLRDCVERGHDEALRGEAVPFSAIRKDRP